MAATTERWSAPVAQRAVRLPRVPSRDTDARIETLRAMGRPVLDLHPYPIRTLPPHVVEAAQAALAEQRQASSRGLWELRVAVANKMAREHVRTIEPATDVLITNGAMQGVNVVFRSILDPGDEVLVPSPCYYFGGPIELAGGVPVYVPMPGGAACEWDVDRLAAAVSRRTRGLLISSPVNPTGHVLSPTELDALAELANRHDLVVISDESYDRLVYDGAVHRSPFGWPGLAERTLLIQSVTKSYAMPGWRIGYVVAPSALLDACEKVLEWEVLSCGYVAQVAAAAAIDGPQHWLADAAAELGANRSQLLAGLCRAPTFTCVPPAGGPFVYLDTHASGRTSAEVAQRLLEEFDIPSVPAEAFTDTDHVRIAFGGTPATISRLIEQLQQASSAFVQTGHP